MIFNKFFIWIIWAMPSAWATAGSLHSVAYGEKTLRIPIAGFTKLLCLEIGIDGFGVKKHVTS